MKRRALILAALICAGAVAAPLAAEERIPGSVIRDRIRDRMEQKRIERTPPLSSARLAPGAGPGRESILVKGHVRTFMRYTPNAVLVGGKRAAVVFALHGGKGTAERLQSYLALNAVADREGFIVVYPQGENGRWNDGRTAENGGGSGLSTADDPSFLNGLADALVAQGVADPKRLYIMGISNGGFMSLALACSGESRFAAFGGVIASLPRTASEGCRPQLPLRAVMINGTQDKLIRFDGSTGRFGIRGNLPPQEAAARLAELAGCAGSADAQLPDVDPADGTRVSKRVWSGCQPGSAVAFYMVTGGGHQPPATAKTASSRLLNAILGASSRDIDTAETVWDFFKRSAK